MTINFIHLTQKLKKNSAVDYEADCKARTFLEYLLILGIEWNDRFEQHHWKSHMMH